METLPEEEKSYWQESVSGPTYAPLVHDLTVDVVIVGGGITGLTSAYLLKQSGLKVAVVEKDCIGSGTTGHTTGKVSSQHGLTYYKLQKIHGEKAAKIYGQANQAAIEEIANIIRQEKIDCEWRIEPNYVYTSDISEAATFKNEAEVARHFGLPASFETKLPLPFKVKAAVKFSDQATFHAQKYITGLAKSVHGDESYVFEQSRIISIRDGNPASVRTANATIRTQHIIVATNVPTLPLMARGTYCALEYPHTSYIIAGYIDKKISGMYISPDKNHYSLLPVVHGRKNLLLVGGENHITGAGGPAINRHQKLADYAQKYFGMKKVEYRWKARDYSAYDDIPLVGKIYPWSKHLYTATAFRKWGLTNSMVAAIILHDAIIGKENSWAETFSSLRLKPITSIPKAVISEFW